MNRKRILCGLILVFICMIVNGVSADNAIIDEEYVLTDEVISENGISYKVRPQQEDMVRKSSFTTDLPKPPRFHDSVFINPPKLGKRDFGMTIGFSDTEVTYKEYSDGHLLVMIGIGTTYQDINKLRKAFTDFRSMSGLQYLRKYGQFGVTSGAVCDFSGRVIIYLYYENDSSGKRRLVEGEAGVLVNGTVTFTEPLPVPIFYLRGKLGLGLTVSFYMEEETRGQVDYKGNIKFEPSGRAGAGVDVIVASVEGGLEAKIPVTYTPFQSAALSERMTVGLNSSLYAEARLFLHRWTWDYRWVGCDLYPNRNCELYKSVEAKSADSFETISRDYLKTATTFASIPEAKTLSRDGLSTKEVLKQSVMPDSDTKLIPLENGDDMLLWLDDDAGRSSENRSALYYAIKTNDVWSAAKVIDDDGTYDYDFDAVCQDGKVYIAWVNIDHQIAAGTLDLQQVLGQSDVVTTIYNISTDSFSPVRVLSTSEAGLESHPVIALSDRNAYVSVLWLLNSEADYTTDTGTNKLIISEYNGTSWSNAASLYETEERLGAYDAVYLNDERTIVFSQQTTVKENQKYDLFLIKGNSAAVQLTSDSANHIYPLLRLENGSVKLYWQADDSFKILDLSSTSTVPSEISTQANAIRGFDVLGQGEDRMILWENPIGWTTHVSAIFRDAEEWGQPLELLQGEDGSLNGLSAYLDGSGNLRLSALTAPVAAKDYAAKGLSEGEEFYGRYDLIYATIENEVYDTALTDNPVFDYEEVEDGADLTLIVSLENSGNQSLERVKVTITDAQGLVVWEKFVDADLASGETGTLKIPFQLPADMVQLDYQISVLPASASNELLTELDATDNTRNLTIGSAVLTVDDLDITNDGKTVHFLTKLSNSGFDASSEITLILSDYDTENEILRVKVPSIAAESTIEYQFDVPTGSFDFANGTEDANVYLEMTISGDDLSAISSLGALVPLVSSEKPGGNPLIFYAPDWFTTDMRLPGTGFPSGHMTRLHAKPAGLNYTATGFELSIPAIDLNTKLVRMPRQDQSWAIEWLGSDAGLMEGTPAIGSGISWIAGHNHLNTAEAGPFALLGTLNLGDVIFIRQPDGVLTTYKVHMNQLYPTDGFEQIFADLPDSSQGLVLLTCENESIDGGYQNRRVVFAEP